MAAAERERKSLAKRATAFLRKVEGVIRKINDAQRHLDLLRVPEPVLSPVRAHLLSLTEHADLARSVRDGVLTEWPSSFDTVPFADAQAALRALVACLNALEKARLSRPS